MGVGALASTFPVASHMPDGGLDSRNLSEALRKRPVTPAELLEPAVSRLVDCLVGVVGDASSPSLVAMTEDFRAAAQAQGLMVKLWILFSANQRDV